MKLGSQDALPVKPLKPSDWLPNPQVEAQVVNADRRVRRRLLARTVGTNFILAVAIVGAFYLSQEKSLMAAPLWVIAALLTMSAAFDAKLRLGGRFRGSGQLGDQLPTDELDGNEIAADIFIQQSGIVTGSDYGTLTFLDGCLMFQGIRSSFCLRPQDVLPANMTPAPYVDDRQGSLKPPEYLTTDDIRRRGPWKALALGGESPVMSVPIRLNLPNRDVEIRIHLGDYKPVAFPNVASFFGRWTPFLNQLASWQKSRSLDVEGIAPPLKWDAVERVPPRWAKFSIYQRQAGGLLLLMSIASAALFGVSPLGMAVELGLLMPALNMLFSPKSLAARRRKVYEKLTGGGP